MYGLLWSDNIGKSGIWWCQKISKYKKILKVVQMKFLAMHITNFDIFTVGNIFMEHDLNI